MPFYRILLTAALSLSLMPLFAGRGEARPEMGADFARERFAAMDADQDGQLSREEFFAAQPNMKDSAFDAIDQNRDGGISLEEWTEFGIGHGRGGVAAMPPHGVNATMPHDRVVMPPQSGNAAMPPHGGNATAPHDGQMGGGQMAPRAPALIPPAKKAD